MTEDKGVTIYCSRCHRGVLLPYADHMKSSVYIAPMKGWTAPPLLCPECVAWLQMVREANIKARIIDA